MNLPVPSSAAGITAAWLAAVLGEEPGDPAAPAPEVTRIGEPYGFASAIFRVVRRAADREASHVVKLWSTEGPGGAREVHFYREIAVDLDLRIPRCVHSALDLCDLLLMSGPAVGPELVETYREALSRGGVEIDRAEITRGVTGALLRKFVASTLGVAGWNPAAPREARVLDSVIVRGQSALLAWAERHPIVEWGV